MTDKMATPEQKNWYRVLSDPDALQRVIQLVSAAVVIQPSNYPKINKASLNIAQDYLTRARSLPPINSSNADRYLRTIANQIIDNLLQRYPGLAVANSSARSGCPPTNSTIVAIGDPRLGNRQLLLTPLSVAYGNQISDRRSPTLPPEIPSMTDAPQMTYITRPSITREQERERIQQVVQAARARR